MYAGVDPAVVPDRQDGGAGRAGLVDASDPVRQPDIVPQRTAEPERADVRGHVVQPGQEHGGACGVPVTGGGRSIFIVPLFSLILVSRFLFLDPFAFSSVMYVHVFFWLFLVSCFLSIDPFSFFVGYVHVLFLLLFFLLFAERLFLVLVVVLLVFCFIFWAFLSSRRFL